MGVQIQWPNNVEKLKWPKPLFGIIVNSIFKRNSSLRRKGGTVPPKIFPQFHFYITKKSQAMRVTDPNITIVK